MCLLRVVCDLPYTVYSCFTVSSFEILRSRRVLFTPETILFLKKKYQEKRGEKRERKTKLKFRRWWKKFPAAHENLIKYPIRPSLLHNAIVCRHDWKKVLEDNFRTCVDSVLSGDTYFHLVVRFSGVWRNGVIAVSRFSWKSFLTENQRKEM